MAKKKRTYSPSRIKGRRTYISKELAEVFRIHIRTIQRWRKDGLAALDEKARPFLFSGEEIIRFLKEKRKKRKQNLKPGEFFCITCRTPRHSKPNKFSIIITGTPLGKTARQAFIKGICETCGRPLTIFSSDRKIQEMRNAGMLPEEHKIALIDNSNSSLNTDILRGQKK